MVPIGMNEGGGRSRPVDGRACAPSGLSRDASQAEPLVPNAALFDAVAAEFDPYIGFQDKPFRGGLLRRAYEWDNGNIRSTAVSAVDGYYGYTCEFSPCPDQHRSEYDTLEELLTAALAGGSQ